MFLTHKFSGIQHIGVGFCIARSADKRDTPYHFKPVQFVVRTAMIGVGLLGLNKGWLEDQNHKLRDALQKNSPHHIKLDDYSQYAPLVALYGLDLVGVRG